MCCTLEPARLSNTILYAAEMMHPSLNRLVHVLGYANSAESRGPNAMLLPLPSLVKMGPENVVDTTKTTKILKDMAEAIRPKTRGMSFSLDEDDDLIVSKGIQVFDAGSYTVVLARNASDIPSVLRFVSADKRPKVNQAIFDAYAKFYPSAQFALCCWSGKVDGDRVEPLFWWYEPSDTSSLFLPGLDAHDGRPPALNVKVDVDHTLIVGSGIRPMSNGDAVYYQDDVTTIKPFLAQRVSGVELDGSLQNGDWRFQVENFSKLSWAGTNGKLFERVSPPSA